MTEQPSLFQLLDRCTKQKFALHRLLEEELPRLRGDDAMLWLLTDDDLNLLPVASARTDPTLFAQLATPVANSRIGLVTALGEPIVIGPEDAHNETVEILSGILTENMVAGPIFLGEELVGVVSCIRSTPSDWFGREDIERIEWLAFLVGAVIGID